MGPQLAKSLDKGFSEGLNILGAQIGQAVHDIQRRVQLAEKIRQLWFQPSVA